MRSDRGHSSGPRRGGYTRGTILRATPLACATAMLLLAGCDAPTDGDAGTSTPDAPSSTGGGGGPCCPSQSSATSPADAASSSIGTGPCCPDPSTLGYNDDFTCYYPGLACPWAWIETGAHGGGVATCEGATWDAQACSDNPAPEGSCPVEGADLGPCVPSDGEACRCVCNESRGVCTQAAACIDGRWTVLRSSLEPGDTCFCGPTTLRVGADGSCSAERPCPLGDQRIECRPSDRGTTCDCTEGDSSIACDQAELGADACSFELGCCADYL